MLTEVFKQITCQNRSMSVVLNALKIIVTSLAAGFVFVGGHNQLMGTLSVCEFRCVRALHGILNGMI